MSHKNHSCLVLWVTLVLISTNALADDTPREILESLSEVAVLDGLGEEHQIPTQNIIDIYAEVFKKFTLQRFLIDSKLNSDGSVTLNYPKIRVNNVDYPLAIQVATHFQPSPVDASLSPYICKQLGFNISIVERYAQVGTEINRAADNSKIGVAINSEADRYAILDRQLKIVRILEKGDTLQGNITVWPEAGRVIASVTCRN